MLLLLVGSPLIFLIRGYFFLSIRYNCGKVCLSLLGTWSGALGENWNKDSTLLQVSLNFFPPFLFLFYSSIPLPFFFLFIRCWSPFKHSFSSEIRISMNLDTNPLEAQNMGKGVVTNTTKPSVSALVCHIFPSLLHRLFSTNPPPSFCYVVQWAMVGALRDTNSVFHEVVKQHFKKRKEVVLERAEASLSLSSTNFSF